MMDETTKEALLEIIHILLSSRTQEHDDGVVRHDHIMFDSVDRVNLNDLYDSLLEIEVKK